MFPLLKLIALCIISSSSSESACSHLVTRTYLTFKWRYFVLQSSINSSTVVNLASVSEYAVNQKLWNCSVVDIYAMMYKCSKQIFQGP